MGAARVMATNLGAKRAARCAFGPCGFVLLVNMMSLSVESYRAASLHSLAPRANGLLANKLVVRLRGGTSDEDSNPASAMRDEDRESSGSDDSDTLLPVTVQNSCFGRSDVFNMTIDADMLVKDLKRDLYAKFSSKVCDPEQMEIWWSGLELQGSSHDTLRSYGLGETPARGNGSRHLTTQRLIVKQKFIFSPEFAGDATRRQQRSGMQMGLAGQQAQVAAMHNARMQALLQDPAELSKLMQSPEIQQIVANNPEVLAKMCAPHCSIGCARIAILIWLNAPLTCSAASQGACAHNPQPELALARDYVQVGEMLKDPEMLRRTMQAASDPAAMRAMLEQQDRMLFNILAQPGGANALKRMTREAGHGGGDGGGGVSDSLVEKERKMRVRPVRAQRLHTRTPTLQSLAPIPRPNPPPQGQGRENC